jgi:hypothetical protein
VRLMMALAVVLLLVGCGQAASPVEKHEKRQGPELVEYGVPPKEGSPYIPDYDIIVEKVCADTGVVGKCYTVASDATSKEDLEVVTADLWLENPEQLVVLVTFYPDKPTADVSGAGFAFKNEQAARVVLKQLTAEGATVEDEVRRAMANGGIYVISAGDEMREFSKVTAGWRSRFLL